MGSVLCMLPLCWLLVWRLSSGVNSLLPFAFEQEKVIRWYLYYGVTLIIINHPETQDYTQVTKTITISISYDSQSIIITKAISPDNFSSPKPHSTNFQNPTMRKEAVKKHEPTLLQLWRRPTWTCCDCGKSGLGLEKEYPVCTLKYWDVRSNSKKPCGHDRCGCCKYQGSYTVDTSHGKWEMETYVAWAILSSPRHAGGGGSFLIRLRYFLFECGALRYPPG